MAVYLYVELNLFAQFILVVIYMNIRGKRVTYLTDLYIYKALLIINFLILSFDSFTWILDGKKEPLLALIFSVSVFCYYLLHPVVCLLWSLYADFEVNHDNKRLIKLLFPLLIPTLISTVYCILSLFGNFYFYIDHNGIYHRGRYFLLLPILCFSYIAFSFCYIIINRRRIYKPYLKSLVSFVIPPIVGALFQILFYGISMIWIGMTISVLFIFVSIQNEQMNLDYLTGLFNQRQLDFYLHKLIRKKKHLIAGIMLDINSFKWINDHYGHSTGDDALKYISRILRNTLGVSGFISRYGGDEFVILLELKERSELEEVIDRLHRNLMEFNSTNTLPFILSISIGADFYNPATKQNEQDFINHIDTLMYHDKNKISAY